jgi:hypothetical protein
LLLCSSGRAERDTRRYRAHQSNSEYVSGHDVLPIVGYGTMIVSPGFSSMF